MAGRFLADLRADLRVRNLGVAEYDLIGQNRVDRTNRAGYPAVRIVRLTSSEILLYWEYSLRE
jgi:hypothetical protein